MHRIFYLLVTVLCLEGMAIPEIVKKSHVEDYLIIYYPHLARAILNDTYDELVSFSTDIYIGVNILKDFQKSTSFYSSNLIGTRWSSYRFVDQQYNFSYADLSFAHMPVADLTKSNLENARLWYAELTYATLACEKIKDADFSYADLMHAKISVEKSVFYISKLLLDYCGARYNGDTTILSPMRRTYRSEEDWQMLFSYDKFLENQKNYK